MKMSNISYYGLSKNLFQNEIECEEIFESTEIKEGLSRLNYLKKVKGIGLIIGVPGVGKTTLIRLFESKLNKELYNMIYINLITNNKFEFLNIICKNLGINVGDCYITSIKRKIQDEIIKQKDIYGKDTIVIIDNAQRLTQELMQELYFLYEFEMGGKDYTSLILCGDENLKYELSKGVNENLSQRIICKYELRPLNKEEVKEYIKTRLELSNQSNEIFNKNALNGLASASHGIIRKLNSLINISMIIGTQEKQTIIDEEIVRLAVEENKL